ncbi:protein of unknown function DUF1745 [Desulfovibrio sp. X2]|uniref:FIST signal transduction protein n=1 Tax=Desulfovibrio sp. X2 TaxID=941449 RepID=UPI0003588D33|nr:FIST N-terminal domain-containing protein [Desulfovibrio sp. X2]EPR37216.1 protein of unknown function DUF1745 [Desulfovibrio sp. X2]
MRDPDFTVAVGHSFTADHDAAVEAVLRACARRLAGRRPSAGLVFASYATMDYGRMLRRIMAEYPGLELVGCAAAGEMSERGMRTGSLLLVLFASDTVRFFSGLGENVSQDPGLALRQASMGWDGAAGPGDVLLPFFDGVRCTGCDMESLFAAAGLGQASVFGGFSGDFLKTHGAVLFHKSRVAADAVAVLGMSGVDVSHGLGSGWVPVGADMSGLAAEGGRLSRIDGERVRDLYRSHIGEDLDMAPYFPLVIRSKASGAVYTRSAAALDPEDGHGDFQGGFPGADLTASFGVIGRREIVLSSEKAAITALQSREQGRTCFALAISCGVRKDILGQSCDAELEALRGALPPDVPLAGVYLTAQVAPLPGVARSFVHNNSFSLVLFQLRNGEKER